MGTTTVNGGLAPMKLGPEGLALIKGFESLRLLAYEDGAGVWTVGYGHTKGVSPRLSISPAQAEAFLRGDIATAEAAVCDLVKVPLSQDQFDALVSFTFNVGPTALQRSTLLRLLNSGGHKDVPNQLARWNRAGGRVMAGLTRRRAAEAALWSKPVDQADAPHAPSLEARVAALEAWRDLVGLRSA